jgi:hypothetical protein
MSTTKRTSKLFGKKEKDDKDDKAAQPDGNKDGSKKLGKVRPPRAP